MPVPLPSDVLLVQYTDQMGRLVRLPAKPRRIVSLVPSQTELLFDLGLEEAVVGLTKFCVHPAGKKKEKIIIGGTKNFHFATIDRLQPDLILGNKEENYREGIEQLAEKYPVWMSDIHNLEEALIMIRQIGQITGTAEEAARLTQKIAEGFACLRPLPSLRVVYLIWKDPYMSVGGDTFIQEMLVRCGLENVFALKARYPQVSPSDLAEAAPQAILLSSEPYPFREKHRKELQSICPGAVVKLVDGEMFSWYGSRLQQAPSYLQSLVAELAEKVK
ncbi:helical backbone metal receptor [soil metagenome]